MTHSGSEADGWAGGRTQPSTPDECQYLSPQWHGDGTCSQQHGACSQRPWRSSATEAPCLQARSNGSMDQIWPKRPSVADPWSSLFWKILGTTLTNNYWAQYLKHQKHSNLQQIDQEAGALPMSCHCKDRQTLKRAQGAAFENKRTSL